MDWEKLKIVVRREDDPEDACLAARPCYVTKFHGSHEFIPAIKDMLGAWVEERKGAPIFLMDKHANRPKRAGPRTLEKMMASFSKKDDYSWFWLNTSPDFNVGEHTIEANLYPFSEGSSSSLYIRQPVGEYAASPPAEWIERFKQAVQSKGLVHASAGYGMDLVWGDGLEDAAGGKLLNACLRYLGLDLPNNDMGPYLLKSIVGPGWLTYLDADMKGRLHRPEAPAPPGFKEVPVGEGVLLIAGDEAPIGDLDASAPDIAPLRHVAKMVRPLRTDFWLEIQLPLSYFEDDQSVEFFTTASKRWLARLDDLPA
jgi:hypothetical protein